MDSNISLQTPSSQLFLGNYISLNGSNIAMNVSSSNISLQSSKAESINISGSNLGISLDSNILFLGGPNIQSTLIQNSNNTISMSQSAINISGSNVNEISITGSNYGIVFSSNNLYVGGSNMDNIYMYSYDSIVKFTSNVFSFVNESGTILLDNQSIYIGGSNQETANITGANFNFIMDGTTLSLSNTGNQLTLTSDSTYIGGQNVSTAQIEGFQYALSLSSNYVGMSNETGRIEMGSNYGYFGGPLIESMTMMTSNSQIVMSSNILLQTGPTTMELSEKGVKIGGAVIFDDIYARNGNFSSNVNVGDKLSFCSGNFSNQHWQIYLDKKSDFTSDLLIKSVNNTLITYTDDFSSELLNFTGKHRCDMHEHEKVFSNGHVKHIGKIVTSFGRYKDLNNKDMIQIDEAIPIVELSCVPFDSRVFGVICEFEKEGNTRNFKIGNLQFRNQKAAGDNKVVINSHGEGGIWVCNVNGNFKNGDLITTSFIQGMGMNQGNEVVKSYTVGKITCDCNFDVKSDIYTCEYFRYKGKLLKKAFVGCVYKV
jgi:hypothetical protein